MLRIHQAQLDALQAHSNADTPQRLLGDLAGLGVTAEGVLPDRLVISDRRGFETRVSFYPSGQLREVERPSGATFRYEHDSPAGATTLQHPGGERWLYRRDDAGLLRGFEVEGHARYELDYDPRSRLNSIVYPDGLRETFDWGRRGAIFRQSSRSGSVYTLTQHEFGERWTDPLDHSVDYRSDDAGMLQGVHFPDGTAEEYAIDGESGAALVTQRSGATVECQTDDSGSPTRITWSDGSMLELEYDPQQRLRSARNAAGSVGFDYDAEGRLVRESSDSGDVAVAFDPDGRTTSVHTGPDEEVRYEYDEDGRLVGIDDWEGRRIRVVPGPDGLPSRIEYPNGVVESWTSGDRPAEVEQALATRQGVSLARRTAGFDENDRLRRLVVEWGDVERLDRRFDYDEEFRLTEETDLATDEPSGRYGYDAAGNMVADGDAAVSFGPMDNPVQRAGESIDYDPLGNVTAFTASKGRVLLDFSADSRLRSASVGDRHSEYEYDGIGRRIQKTDGAATWTYGWLGFQMLWEEYRAGPTADPVRRDYLYVPGTVVPIAFREGGETFWVQSDHRGAVTAVHDGSGRLVWFGVYDGFGNVRAVVDDVRQPWRLSGQYYDDETGLHYNIVRYYSPELKSFLSLDPSWQHPEGSKYSYCLNDPWNRADPLGMLAFLALAAITVVAAGLISGAISAYMAPKGEKLAAFGKGAAVGAGAALVGVGVAALLPAVGVAATSVAGLAAIGAVEGAAASALDDVANDRPICWNCMAMSAGMGAVLGVVIPGVGGILGRKAANVLGPRVRPLLSRVFRRAPPPTPKFTVAPNKFNYFFGKIAPPDEALKTTNPAKYKKLKHNYDRSQQNKANLAREGIEDTPEGRRRLEDIFEQAADGPKVATHSGEHGTTVTRSTYDGGTRYDVKYFYEAGDMASKPKVVSVIPKIMR